MIKTQTFLISTESAGKRLDRVLLERFPATTHNLIAKAIQEKNITINGQPTEKGYKVQDQDTLAVQQLDEATDRCVTPNPNVLIDVIFEDDFILVFHKPAGMAVHPVNPDETGTLANGIVARWPDLAAIGEDRLFPAILHRLDTDTSGVMIAAKTPSTYTTLRQQFHAHHVQKIYLALIHGHPIRKGRLEGYLTHEKKNRGKMCVVDTAHRTAKAEVFRAVTEYSLAGYYRDYTLLEVRIPTGVTHQIRCQLAHHGYPIAGDNLYGDHRFSIQGLHRQFLHAWKLILHHPGTAKEMVFTANLPPELSNILNALSVPAVPKTCRHAQQSPRPKASPRS